jgi:hypothetical protein
MTIDDIIRYLHIGAGTIALAAFWTAATLRKGSRSHRGVGRTFMIAIIAVCVTGIPIALAAFRGGQPVTGTFLLYLVLITATPCWLAWRAVRDKHHVKRFAGPMYQVLAWLYIIAGGGTLVLGIRYSQPIIAGVACVGLIAGPLMLRFAWNPPTGKQWWLARHYGSILAVGIATHIAFFNIGLSRLLPPEQGVAAQRLSWFLPFVLAFVARQLLQRKYSPQPKLSTANVPIDRAQTIGDHVS